MVLGYSCTFCGSPFCRGECQAQVYQHQMIQLQNAQVGSLMGIQGLQNGQIGGVLAPSQEFVQTHRKPLPEEHVLCATGGIIAWRSWKVPCFGTTLLSLNGTVWPIREPLQAKCGNGDSACQGLHCTCGSYAWKDRKNLEQNRTPASMIDGEVWLWGQIIEHEKGYRAEFAYPKSFVDSGYLAQKMAKIYGVKLL